MPAIDYRIEIAKYSFGKDNPKEHMLNIKRAKPDAFHMVRDFYHQLIDDLKDFPHKPKWVKGIYPCDDYLENALAQKTLFVGISSEALCAAMIVNQTHNEKYSEINWPTPALKDEVTIIHALGVLPSYSGRGFGSQMVKAAIRKALTKKHKAIRLDVLVNNFPAIFLYEKLGFQYVDTVKMYYPDSGWADFNLYEYPLIHSK